MNYNPDHAAISVVGDFNSKEMKAALTVLFQNGRNRQKKKVLLQNDCHPQESRVLLVNKEDAREPLFYMRQE
jgi:predicted Zn-dependent peptidase